MSLRQMTERAIVADSETYQKWLESIPPVDNTPIEVTPINQPKISTIDDLRNMMLQISREQEEAGNETYDEFFDFELDQDFESVPAPAQSKHDAIQAARDYDFEEELARNRDAYEARVKAEALKMLDKERARREDAPRSSKDRAEPEV